MLQVSRAVLEVQRKRFQEQESPHGTYSQEEG